MKLNIHANVVQSHENMQPDTLSSICLLDVVLIEALYVKKNGRSKLKDSDDQSRFDEIFRSPGPMKDETD